MSKRLKLQPLRHTLDDSGLQLAVDCLRRDLLDPVLSSKDEVGAFADAYLLDEILSKYPFKVPGLDRRKVALDKFLDCEQQCSLVNETIRLDTTGPFGVSWLSVLSTASRKISRLLGKLDLDEVEKHCSMGPGASTSLRRTRSDAYYKYGQKPDVTEDCLHFAWCLIVRQPAWFRSLTGFEPTGDWVLDYCRSIDKMFNIQPGNRVTTVPKNSKTDRIIAVEPDMNMYVQKGIGGVIRRRLRRVGVDLNRQVRNQRLAKRASRYGRMATIDFSSASDTISLSIVEELLPPDWLCALKQARSPVGVLPDGTVVQYSKFSSMGNGYTFELESLIFWALASACYDLLGVKGIVSVYGDDVILTSDPRIRDLFQWVCDRAGFTLNASKTFWDGPFRESCGKHYFRGIDVSPIYIRRPIKNVWDLYSLANKIRKRARLSWGLDPRFKRFYDIVVDQIPHAFRRYKIPDGIGDVGLVCDFDEASPRFCRKTFCLVADSFHPVFRRRRVEGNSLLTKWFHGGNTESSVAVLNVVEEPIFGGTSRSLVSRWPNYGSWL